MHALPLPLHALEAGQREAIAAARTAAAAGELPYGAVVLRPDGQVAANAHDEVEHDDDLTSHAELLAIRRCAATHGRDLAGHVLVSTVEPCAMCFSAAWTAGLAGVAFGLTMTELGDARPEALDEVVISSADLNRLGRRRLAIVPGLLHAECRALWD